MRKNKVKNIKINYDFDTGVPDTKTIVRNKTEIKTEEPMLLKSRERVATPPEVKTLVSKIIGKDKHNYWNVQ